MVPSVLRSCTPTIRPKTFKSPFFPFWFCAVNLCLNLCHKFLYLFSFSCFNQTRNQCVINIFVFAQKGGDGFCSALQIKGQQQNDIDNNDWTSQKWLSRNHTCCSRTIQMRWQWQNGAEKMIMAEWHRWNGNDRWNDNDRMTQLKWQWQMKWQWQNDTDNNSKWHSRGKMAMMTETTLQKITFTSE